MGGPGRPRAPVTHSVHSLDTWAGTVYLQSMIIVSVSLSLASWKGGCPHTSMNRITPRLHISAHGRQAVRRGLVGAPKHPRARRLMGSF